MSSVATHHNEFAARPPTDRSCRICNPLMPVTDRQTDSRAVRCQHSATAAAAAAVMQ